MKGRIALEYVERVRNSYCTGGTEETLPVEFDHDVWANYADVAVRMANLLTKIVIQVGVDSLFNRRQLLHYRSRTYFVSKLLYLYTYQKTAK